MSFFFIFYTKLIQWNHCNWNSFILSSILFFFSSSLLNKIWILLYIVTIFKVVKADADEDSDDDQGELYAKKKCSRNKIGDLKCSAIFQLKANLLVNDNVYFFLSVWMLGMYPK